MGVTDRIRSLGRKLSSAGSARDFTTLLERHVPIMRYDSQEPYFADSAAEWTDNPANVLRRVDGTEIASARGPGSGLSLGFLQHPRYADGAEVRGTDRIADAAHDYEAQARALHARAQYANRTYGHWAIGSDGRIWLAYWFFYFYNDYNLIGDLLPVGLHEGDWEMVQLRLDSAARAPDLAVYAQHDYAEERPWEQVERDASGQRPLVYPGRGSHASYFSAGYHLTGPLLKGWFEHADGKRAGPELKLEVIADDDPGFAWATWPGMWGGTEPRHHENELDEIVEDSSPKGPGHHAQWRNPTSLQEKLKGAAAQAALTPPPLPTQPKIMLAREGESLVLDYETAEPKLERLIIAVAPSGERVPATVYRRAVQKPSGTLRIEHALPASGHYEVHVSIATGEGLSSVSASGEV